ncbi:MAG: hypothetical protein QOD67_2585, partial [Caballeronia sp.]|nr:hypothetical protein [Caballeronia sp.]
MTTKTAPKAPSPAAKAADTRVKLLPFAFPFLRKGQGKSDASAKFTDEHDIYRLLAEREPSGSYLVSKTGMWHGGIHVTDTGAGQALDLDAGVRCIADGRVIAYRINQTYPLSDVSDANSEATAPAPYSTGFTLVRHSMEFPKGATLTFYSLYMHLQAYEDYTNDSKRQKPAYWSMQFEVTEFAKDTPTPSKTGQLAEAGQEGLRVRQSPPHGSPIGILPLGASVSIGEQKKGWGRIKELNGSSLYAPVAGGFVEPSAAVGGWIFLGNENGGPLVREVMPDASFERVMFPSITASPTGDSGPGVPIKAGDLIGHSGRYDSLNQRTAGTRMVHIEVFCDDSIDSFITQARAWVEEHGPHPKDWTAVGLSAEPTILRIEPKTKLYKDHDKDGEGANAPLTDVIQVYAFGELGRDKNRQFTEAKEDASLGRKVNWWHVENADALGNPIEGWVREYKHGSGRVTREFAQKWIDFQCLADAHDPAHTIFATSQAWVDYASGANVPGAAALDKLSPLMGEKVYRALFAKGDGSHAADDLCNAAASDAGHYPWLMQALSRLIVKHESEWANSEKWKQLIDELEKQTGPKAQHAEELKRIDKLTWWDEVRAGVPGFPGPEVFHIHPIGLVGNFHQELQLITLEMLLAVDSSNSRQYYDSILAYLNAYAKVYEVGSPKRIAHFLSQAAHESHFRASEEDLTYGPKNMRKTFGCKGGKKNYNVACDDCTHGRLRDKLWSLESHYSNNPEHLANYVYADRLDNGDESSGDGF